jgi:YD repeat-containing protein
MKKKLLTVVAFVMMAALTACERNNEKPSVTATPTVTPTATIAPVQKPTPVVTEAPTPTGESTPVVTPEPIPSGFSDKELEERAKAEAAEMKYAYRAENVFDGCSSEFWALNTYVDPEKWNKAITLYDADGNTIASKYYLNDRETEAVIRTHFGTLHTRYDGSAPDTIWILGGLPYTETDEQGRKTVELGGWNKTFYAYDQNGNLIRKLIYENDSLTHRELYSYDGKGNVLTEEITLFPSGQSNRSYLKKTYSEGRLVLCEVDSEDAYWVSEMIPMPANFMYYSYYARFQVSYDYDADGAMSSMEINPGTVDETEKFLYSFTRDEKGRITEATETDSDHISKNILKIKYFDNGPVLVIPMRQQGDTVVYGDKAVAFFPTEECRAMLERGNGHSFDALKKETEKMNWATGVSWPEELNPMFDERFRDYYVRSKEGRTLATISDSWGSDTSSYEEMIKSLLGQKNFPLDKAVKSMTGGWSLYKNDRLLESSYYGGGGGANSYEIIEYDNAGRVTGLSRGSDDKNTYEFTYDNAGRVSRMTYSYDPGFDYGCSYKGTVTYSYDAEGKTVAMNGDFTGEPNEETEGNAFKQTFRLTAVSGNVIE